MTERQMQEAVTADLKTELQATEPEVNEPLLASKVMNAIREVRAARAYPDGCREAMVEDDMKRFYSNVRNLALYDYNKSGVDFQQTFNENGGSGSFVDRDKLFYGVVPIAGVR